MVKKEVKQLIDDIIDEVADVGTIEGACSSCYDNADLYVTVDNKYRNGVREITDFEKLTAGILAVISKHNKLLKEMIK